MSARDFDVIDAVHGLQERGWVVVSPAELRAGYRILGAEQGAALAIQTIARAGASGKQWSPAMSARDVIADCYAFATNARPHMTADEFAFHLSTALTAAGYRILAPGRFREGERVTKIGGSSWTGRVVGTYSTTLTPEGYCVESENEHGSVQIYPAAALRSLGGGE